MPVYLDHAAGSPVRPEVLEVYAAALAESGNASAIHRHGQAARDRAETGRERLAAALGVGREEVQLTAGGTEAVNLGIQGLYRARRAGDARRRRILLPDGEHAATVDTVGWLAAQEGAIVVRIGIDALGRIRLDELEAALAEAPGETALVTALWANNEVGTLQPVEAIVAAAARHGVPVHLDAIAAFGRVPLPLRAVGAAAVSLSGHKIGAPVSTGALVVARSAVVEPLLHGGGQQRFRSGTLDPAGALALGLAAELATAELPVAAERMRALAVRLAAGATALDGVALRGDPSADGRLPGNVHLTVAGAEGETLVYLLDASDVSASVGSACRAGVAEPSRVLLGMGLDAATARGALRLTLGPASTGDDVEAALAVLPDAVARARAAGDGRRDGRRTDGLRSGGLDA